MIKLWLYFESIKVLFDKRKFLRINVIIRHRQVLFSFLKISIPRIKFLFSHLFSPFYIWDSSKLLSILDDFLHQIVVSAIMIQVLIKLKSPIDLLELDLNVFSSENRRHSEVFLDQGLCILRTFQFLIEFFNCFFCSFNNFLLIF